MIGDWSDIIRWKHFWLGREWTRSKGHLFAGYIFELVFFCDPWLLFFRFMRYSTFRRLQREQSLRELCRK